MCFSVRCARDKDGTAVGSSLHKQYCSSLVQINPRLKEGSSRLIDAGICFAGSSPTCAQATKKSNRGTKKDFDRVA